MSKPALRGLYLITNDDPWPILCNKLHAALSEGVTLSEGVALLQYRRKQTAPEQQAEEAAAIFDLCQQYGVPLVINDHLELAAWLGCGLHLGQGDGSVQQARQRLGASVVIGRTCHDSLDLALQAQADGASYVAFGAVFASQTKPNARSVAVATLQQAKQCLRIPLCAIGGLTVENSAILKPLVDLFAVVGDVLALPVDQVPSRVQQWQQLIQP